MVFYHVGPDGILKSEPKTMIKSAVGGAVLDDVVAVFDAVGNQLLDR